jgi:hypothetical protein
MGEILAALLVEQAVKSLRRGDGWGALLCVGLAAICAGNNSEQ